MTPPSKVEDDVKDRWDISSGLPQFSSAMVRIILFLVVGKHFGEPPKQNT